MAANVFFPTYGAVGTDPELQLERTGRLSRFLVDPTSARIKLIIVERKPASRVPHAFAMQSESWNWPWKWESSHD